MALREIGAVLTLEGEQEWKAQLSSSAREMKNLKSELVASQAEFNGTANSIDALRAKQSILAQQQAQQTERVRALAAAMQSAETVYGANSVKLDALRQQYNYARAQLAKLNDEVEENSKYLAEAEAASDGCAISIDGYGKQVKEAASGSGSLLDKLNGLIPGLDLAAAKGTLTGAALTAAFKKAWDWAMQLVDETKELREGLAMLEQTASAAGTAFDAELNDSLREIYTLTGEMDSSLEALSNLLAAGYSDDDNMAAIIQQLSGAIIQFPDTLKIESLADSLQETLATGKSVGQFDELLSRLGVDVGTFSDNLSACTTEAEAQDLVFRTLAAQGLGDVSSAYRQANADLLALNEAEYNLQVANAELAESLVPAKTAMTNFRAEFSLMLADMFRVEDRLQFTDDLSYMLAASMGMTETELASWLKSVGVSIADFRSGMAECGMTALEYKEQLDAAAMATEDVTEATEDYTSALATDKESVEDALATLEALQMQYEAVRSSIDSAVGGFTNMDDAMAGFDADTDAMLEALQSQIDYLANYEANLQAVRDMGLSEALIEELADGSAESAAYLQAIVDDGGASIEELNEKFAAVETGKQSFVDTVAGMLPEFAETLSEVTATLDAAVEDWNKYDEAATAGQNTVNGLLSSLNGRYGELLAAGISMGNAVMAGYNMALDINSPSRKMGQAMDNTVDGAVLEGQRRLRDMELTGVALGSAVESGYRAASGLRADLRRDSASAAGTTAASGNGKSVEITIQPQTMDSAQTDYLLRRIDSELGGDL